MTGAEAGKIKQEPNTAPYTRGRSSELRSRVGCPHAPCRSRVVSRSAQLRVRLLQRCPLAAQRGSALSIGDFDGDGLMELSVGVPNEKASGNPFHDRGTVEGIIQVFEAGSATLQPQARTWNAHSS